MANVIYAPEADEDLFGIVEYIARDKPNAARYWLGKRRAKQLQLSQSWANCGPALVRQVLGHSASATT